jgi:serine/threonine-protein kinase RsbW
MPGGESRNADLQLASTLESVDSAEGVVLDAARTAGLDEEELHKVGIAVRETMVNAIAHGNRYNARKKVRLQVWTEASRLVIEIQDEGNGFEMNAVPDPLAQENLLRQSGRGLLMIQAFMDELEVRPGHPAGTCVRMVKYLQGRSSGSADA